jgi:hypothetical protein
VVRKPYVTVRSVNVWNLGEIRIARGSLAITLVSSDGTEHKVGVSVSDIVKLEVGQEIRNEAVVVRLVEFKFKLAPRLKVLFFQKNEEFVTHTVVVKHSDFCVRASVLG